MKFEFPALFWVTSWPFHTIPVTPKSYTRHPHYTKILAPPKHYKLESLNFPPFSRPYPDWLGWCLKIPEVVTKSRKTHAVKISAQSALRGQRYGHFTKIQNLNFLPFFLGHSWVVSHHPRHAKILFWPSQRRQNPILTIPATPKSLRHQKHYILRNLNFLPFSRPYLEWLGWCLKMPEVVTKSRKIHAVEISAQPAQRGQRYSHFTKMQNLNFPPFISLSLLGSFTPSPPRQNPFLAIPTPPKSYTSHPRYAKILAPPKHYIQSISVNWAPG